MQRMMFETDAAAMATVWVLVGPLGSPVGVGPVVGRCDNGHALRREGSYYEAAVCLTCGHRYAKQPSLF